MARSAGSRRWRQPSDALGIEVVEGDLPAPRPQYAKRTSRSSVVAFLKQYPGQHFTAQQIASGLRKRGELGSGMGAVESIKRMLAHIDNVVRVTNAKAPRRAARYFWDEGRAAEGAY